MKAFLVRHGETDYNAKRLFQGYSPIPLSPRGRQQAARVAERLADLTPKVLYSSDIRRSEETAEFISQRLALPIQHCAGLREWNVGTWEHKTAAEFDTHLQDIGAHIVSYVPEGGESQLQTQARMIAQMNTLANQHAGETILCVSHGKAIDMFARYVLGLDAMQTPAYTITNTSVSIFSWQNHTWEVVTLNEVGHLEGLEG
jgi:broad specificity phosphatase PhoE